MQRRKAAGLTQEDLAEKVGLSKNHLSNIECGKYIPTTSFILKICEVLGKTPDYYLIGGIAEPTTDISALIKQLPPESQRILYALLETYLNELYPT